MKVKSKSFGSMDNNCYLLIDEKTNAAVMIDCPEFSDEMLSFIGDSDLKYILLTHGHYDHIGGVCDVKEKYGCDVCISSLDAPMLSSTKLSLGAFCGVSHKSVSADRLIGEGDKIECGDIIIDVIETPGHTKGGLCFISQDYIFTGDTLFYCSCGRTDFPGGDSNEMLLSLKRIKNLDGDLKVMPGHDRFSTLDFERQNNVYMKL